MIMGGIIMPGTVIEKGWFDRILMVGNLETVE